MKQAGGTVKVAKNRLAKLALKETDNADISALFTGPTVIAFAKDPMTAPKVAAAFADKNQKFEVLGGAMGKTGLDPNNVKALATMPSLDQLRATLAGMLKQPGTRIASVLQAPGGADCSGPLGSRREGQRSIGNHSNQGSPGPSTVRTETVQRKVNSNG